MKSQTKRAQQALETKQRIFQTAISLFEKHGVENVTMQDIAGESGCSIGSIYHYFRSKDEIVLKMLQPADEAYGDFYEKLTRAEPFCSMTAKEQLVEFYCKAVEICTHVPDTLREYYLFSIKYPDYGMLQLTGERRFQQIGLELLEKLSHEEVLPVNLSHERILYYLVVQLRGLFSDWLIMGCKYDAVSAARIQIDLFIKGITAS